MSAPSVVLLVDKPHDGRLTISYCPEGSLIAKTLVVPKKAFFEACRKTADELAAEPATP